MIILEEFKNYADGGLFPTIKRTNSFSQLGI